MSDVEAVYIKGAMLARENAHGWFRSARLWPDDREFFLANARKCLVRGRAYLHTARTVRYITGGKHERAA